MADPPIPPPIPPKAIDPWRLLVYAPNRHIPPIVRFFLTPSTLIQLQPSALSPELSTTRFIATSQSSRYTTSSPQISALPISEISTYIQPQLCPSRPVPLKMISFAIFSIGICLLVLHTYTGQARFECHLSENTKEQFPHLSIHLERYDNITTSSEKFSTFREINLNPLRLTLSTPQYPQLYLLVTSMFQFLEQLTVTSKYIGYENTNDKSVCIMLLSFSSLFHRKVSLQPYSSISPSIPSAAPPQVIMTISAHLDSEAPGFHHNSAPEVSPTVEEVQIAVTSPKSFKSAVSDLPTTISYTSDTIFLLCQLRRSQDFDADLQLATMHNDGSAVKFIESLIQQSFKAYPALSSLKQALRIRDIEFRCLQNSVTPTYSVAFSALLTSTPGAKPVYARYGTPTFKDLEAYLHDFVFERWHCKAELNLDSSKQLISRFFFLIPPCNHPYNKPIAYVSGLPPSIFGRKHLHTKAILSQLHIVLKAKLPSNSKLHNFPYFSQAFGLQVRRNYTFMEGVQEDVYVAYISNHTDQLLLSNLIFPSSTQTTPNLKLYNLPTTFIPIPTRPAASAQGALSQHYQCLRAISADIRKKRQMLELLPSISTPIFKDPLAPSTRSLILANKNIVTYAVLHSIQKGVNTKLYLRNKPTESHNYDPLIRSWFEESVRESLFFAKSTYAPHATSIPAQSILSAVLKNLDASAIHFAATLGVEDVPDPGIPEQKKSKARSIRKPNQSSTPLPPAEVTEVSPSKQARKIPSFNPPPPILPHVPLLSDDTKSHAITHLTPLKRQVCSPPSDLSPKSAPPPMSKSKLNCPATPDSNTSTSTTSNSAPSSPDTDASPGTQTQQIESITKTLRSSVSSRKQMFINEESLSTMAYNVCQADNLQDAILQAKTDLKSEVTSLFNDFNKYKDKQHKKKLRSSKKSKTKKENPAFI